MKLDFVSKSISVPPWLFVLTLVVIILLTVMITKRFARRQAPLPTVQEPQTTDSMDTTGLFEIHVPTLDARPSSEKKIMYPAKLRFSLKNTSSKPIHVSGLRWLVSDGNISLQCGAAPYPNEIYRPGMLELCYAYQLERSLGSWQKDQWQMKGSENKDHDERGDLFVPPDWTFRIWIGMNPCVPEQVLKNRLRVNKLGTLILPLLVGDKRCEWKTDF
jgi:hypothetical protein